MPFEFFKRESRQEHATVATFSKLETYLSGLPSNERPSALAILEDVYNLVNEVMPYSKEGAEDFEFENTQRMGLKSNDDPMKVSLTSYLRFGRFDKSVTVCRHQALLAALLIEKLIDLHILPNTFHVTRGSNSIPGYGHAWAHVVENTQKNSNRTYIVDVAQHVLGELVTTPEGSFVNGIKCNTGKSHEWSDSKLWPYQHFDNKDAADHLQGRYTLLATDKKESSSDQVLKNEKRHLITRTSRIDQGYKWDGVDQTALVVDWNKYYTTGYDLLEQRLCNAIYERTHKGKLQAKIENAHQSPASAIRGANDFKKLYSVLKKIGNIQGTKQLFTPSRLIEIIEQVRSGKLALQHVTSTFGLREKVEELFLKDK
jgi:hypothetical protein